MDVVTASPADAVRTEASSSSPAPVKRSEPATPPENRLQMPVQSFRTFDKRERRKPVGRWTTPWLKRLFVFGGGFALTAYGAYEMYHVVSVSRTTSLQYVLLVLFTINFSWIALAFTSALLGFAALTAVLAFGGSTNAIPHLIAMARRAGL